MTADRISESYVEAQLASIEAQLPGCTSEANALVELSRNAERTGVMWDGRTGQRRQHLEEKVGAWRQQVLDWETQVPNDFLRSRMRVLKSTLDAMAEEVRSTGR